jgi:hypothetical protein
MEINYLDLRIKNTLDHKYGDFITNQEQEELNLKFLNITTKNLSLNDWSFYILNIFSTGLN